MNLFAILLFAASAAELPTVTLVESAPIETHLDHTDIPNFANAWLTAIEGARSHIELAHFYAADSGELGSSDPAHPTRLTPIIGALEAAAARGVKVRWLADAGFARTYPALLERLAAHANIEVRRYWMPRIRRVDYAPGLGVESALQIEPQSGPAMRGEERAGVMHAKYMLVDGTNVIFGSANFDWRSLEHIQELGCWLTGASLARPFAAVFEVDWQLAGGGKLPEAGRDPTGPQSFEATFVPIDSSAASSTIHVTPVFSPRGLLPDASQWDLPGLVARIDAAESRVFVQVLTYRASGYGDYFAALDTALRRAAARGVDVRLLVADWSKRDSITPDLKSLAVMPHLEVRFVTIPEARAGHIPFARVVHSKYMVVDSDKAWIGTANWSRSYFEAGRNVGLLLDGEAPASRLAELFTELWDGELVEPVDAGKHYVAPDYGERK